MALDKLFNDSKTFTPVTFDSFTGKTKPYLIISYGMGRDSTAVLILCRRLGIRPDLVIWSNTGAEKDATYAYLPTINGWLRSVGFPEVTVIGAGRKRDAGIESHLFRLGIFAGLSYGKHNCSVIWKIKPQDGYLKSCRPVIEAKREGRKIVRAVGFEASEQYRARRAAADAITETTDETGCLRTTAFAVSDQSEYITWYPLIEKNIDFAGVCDIIREENLPLPKKSSCIMCAAMTAPEIRELARDEPHNFFRCLVLERVVERNVIVKAGRVKGIAFGRKWSDYDFAAPYLSRTDEVIELFGFDRAAADGDPRPNAVAWKKKAARVGLFRAYFSTADALSRFMTRTADLTGCKNKLAEIECMDTGDRQLMLSCNFGEITGAADQ